MNTLIDYFIFLNQLTLTARDNGGLTDTGSVTVSINRNIFDPEWLPVGGPYGGEINVIENRPVLETVYTLSSRDQDIQVYQELGILQLKSIIHVFILL